MVLWLLFSLITASAVKITIPEYKESSVRDVLDRLPAWISSEFPDIVINSFSELVDGRVRIMVDPLGRKTVEANSPTAALYGINYFLRNHCFTQISWENSSFGEGCEDVRDTEIELIAPKVRYFGNPCTFSYSFAWWQWKNWERMIDWLALNGFNMVLAPIGQEAIWRDVFISLGVDRRKLDDYFTGPAYLAWHRMGNLKRWGGPLSESLMENQLELNVKIVSRMVELGIVPVLPTFSGFVPNDLVRSKINRNGKKLDAIMFFDRLLQSWTFFYDKWPNKAVKAFLSGVPVGKLLVLDLYAENHPLWLEFNSFFGHSFVWCMLHNFGGTTEMRGNIKHLNKAYQLALSSSNTFVGAGLTMEAIQQNYIVYQFVIDRIWSKDLVPLNEWYEAFQLYLTQLVMNTYVSSRYQLSSTAASKAWSLLLRTLYSEPVKMDTERFSVFIYFRPSFGKRIKYWFDPSVLRTIAGYFIQLKEIMWDNPLFREDYNDVMREALQYELGNKVILRVYEGYGSGDNEEILKACRNLDTMFENIERHTNNDLLEWIGSTTLTSTTPYWNLLNYLLYSNPSNTVVRLVGFPGELFMNMLKAMILPLIVASLISGLSQLDGKTSGKLGCRAIMYYALTTTHAVVLGIIIVILIHPGDPTIKKHLEITDIVHAKVSALDKFLDLFRNMFPENIIRSTFQQQQTVNVIINETTGSEVATIQYSDGMNVLGKATFYNANNYCLIIFCIVMGLVISRVGKPARPLADLFIALDIVISRIVFLIMWFGPIGIPSLIAQKMLEVNDLVGTARMLFMFMLTVIAGLTIQCFVTLPLIFFIGTRHNPYKFLRGLGQAVLTALGTASSAACLPITFQCLKDMGIDSRVTKFVLPVGAMVNMDGTALYEAVASIFIAQMNGMELSFGKVLTVSVTATLASIGAASIPGAGLVTMLIVLTALGLPANDVSLIIAIDWFLDRLRTSVNVIGDAFGCGFVHFLCIGDLNELSIPDQNDKEAIKPTTMSHGINFDDLEKNIENNNNAHNIHISTMIAYCFFSLLLKHLIFLNTTVAQVTEKMIHMPELDMRFMFNLFIAMTAHIHYPSVNDDGHITVQNILVLCVSANFTLYYQLCPQSIVRGNLTVNPRPRNATHQ
uniref:Alpha-N-acetylglucosaminidase n=1 Tax=Heterorhabditis bacteriophora TaxID=37862 RepID=A0A1I7XPG7_HETBA